MAPETAAPGAQAAQPAGAAAGQKPLRVLRPHFPLMAAYFTFHALFYLAIAVVALLVVKTFFVPDLFSFYKEVIENLRLASGSAGDLMLMLISNLWQTVILAFVQFLALALVLQIPMLNLRWRIFPDCLEHKKGFLLVRIERLSYTDIADVSFERHVSGFDFGKIVVEYSGAEGRWLELPYIRGVSGLTAELNNLVKAAKEREFGAQQPARQPAQEKAPPVSQQQPGR